jgi:hypothetical protein
MNNGKIISPFWIVFSFIVAGSMAFMWYKGFEFFVIAWIGFYLVLITNQHDKT